MKYTDLLLETYIALTSNKTRTGLTMLGIVIGIASVITMLSIGAGAQASIQSNIQSLGSNILTVSPGGGGGRGGPVNEGRNNGQQTLKLDDALALKTISTIRALSPEVTSRKQVIFGSNNTNTSIVGATPDYILAHSVDMEEGIFIDDSQYTGYAKVAVLGPTTRDDLFGVGGDALGAKIRIDKTTYTVIGVTKSKGGTGFGNADDRIFIPLSTAQQYLTGNRYVGSITISITNAEDITDTQTQIQDMLLSRHKIVDPALADFSIFNQADVASSLATVTQTFTILLGSVGAISLLVGGIGIMNMMLTNVRERTREIGLRKAIGAHKKDINAQFLTESIMITMIGGIIGILLGLAISKGISLTGLVTTSVTLFSVLLSFGVSTLVGIIFGYYPASKASELNPIEALRYE